jgi:hypothetical protein
LTSSSVKQALIQGLVMLVGGKKNKYGRTAPIFLRLLSFNVIQAIGVS